MSYQHHSPTSASTDSSNQSQPWLHARIIHGSFMDPGRIHAERSPSDEVSSAEVNRTLQCERCFKTGTDTTLPLQLARKMGLLKEGRQLERELPWNGNKLGCLFISKVKTIQTHYSKIPCLNTRLTEICKVSLGLSSWVSTCQRPGPAPTLFTQHLAF